MRRIHEFRDYKKFLRSWIAEQPKKGRGISSRMSEALRLSPAMLSQVLNGDKNLSPEAANDAASFLGLNDEETEYLLLLVSFARAGSSALRERLQRRVLAEQNRARELEKKLKPDRELSEDVRGTFYSHWIYTGIRNMTACADFKTVDDIAAHLHVSRTTVSRVVDFLLQNGLCKQEKGKLDVGPQITHVPHHSPLAARHHANWRMHGLTKMFEPNDRNVFFTSPMSLSNETAEEIRALIPSFIEQIRKLVGPSPSEVVRCLNVDWFDF